MVYADFRRHLAEVEAEYAILEKENFALRSRLESFVNEQVEQDSNPQPDICIDMSKSDRTTVGSDNAVDFKLMSSAMTSGRTLNDIELSPPARNLLCDGMHCTKPRPFKASALENGETEGIRELPWQPTSPAKSAGESPMKKGKTTRFSTSWAMHPSPADEDDCLPPRKPIFASVDDMKTAVRNHLVEKQYDVSDFYKRTGVASYIARHPVFEIVTLIVIGCNAIWIAVDTDYNKKHILLEAELLFQIVENVFCVYFFVEILIRFSAFEEKVNCVRDLWFIFDAVLVFMMALETWVLTIVLSMGSESSTKESLGDASVMRLARLLRLTRMARMARLLRAVPELVILVKGMVSAARSVFFTLLLLLILLYVFAIAFTQLLEDTDVGKDFFSNVGHSMHTLWLFATLIDEISTLAMTIQKESYLCVVLTDLFILAASLTVMNMLIGVLCEVVSAVAASEREELSLHVVKSKVQKIFYSMGLDSDNNGMISKEEFRKIMEHRDAARAINDLGVDVIELVDMADFFFAQNFEDDEYGREFEFSDFMNMVVQLRGSNTATVKDIMLLRKFISVELQTIQKSRGSPSFYTKSKSSSPIMNGTSSVTDCLGEREQPPQVVGAVTTSPLVLPLEGSPKPPDVPPATLPLVRPSSAKAERESLLSQDSIQRVDEADSYLPGSAPDTYQRENSNLTLGDLS